MAWQKPLGVKLETPAHMLGVSQAAVSHWENGRDVAQRVGIVCALTVQPETLLLGEPPWRAARDDQADPAKGTRWSCRGLVPLL